MTSQTKAFLTELYEIDPSLQEHEAELIHLIETLLKHNPKIAIDQQFVQQLRTKLQDRASTLSSSHSFFSFLTMPKYSLAIIGALAGILVTGPTVYYMTNSNTALPQATNEEAQDLFAFRASEAADKAFGTLSATEPGLGSGNPATISARPQSGGGGPAYGMAGGGGDMAVDGKMIAPYPPEGITQLNYVYKGGDFAMPTGEVTVYKRVRGNLNLPGVSGLASADLGILNLSAFPGLKIDSLTAYQDTKNGYMISLNMRDGSMSVNQNWEQWTYPGANCRDEACYNALRLKISDVPSDEQIIAIAENFMKQFGFNLENVGQPYVDNGWKMSYEQTVDKSQYYIPEQMSVVYPFLLDGKEAFEQYGGKSGVSVSVDIRQNKVAGVWNLYTQTYETSAYPAVTDKSKVMNYLERFGKIPMGLYGTETKIEQKEVELGTPTEGLMHTYTFKNNSQQDLYVPALIFPVTKQPEGTNYYTQPFVIVPLAQELLDAQDQMGTPMPVDGTVRIMEEETK